MPPMRRAARRTSRRTARRTSRRVNRRHDAAAAAYAPQPAAEPAYAPEPAAAPAPAATEPDRFEELKQLGQLHEQGILTDEEFAAEKAKILNQG